MHQAVLIFKRELKDYFVSPIAYIVIAIFLFAVGVLFFVDFFAYGQANLVRFFGRLPWMFALVVPAITMRLFSEELNVGSYEILLTLPVTFRDIIVGKFMAGVAFVAAILIPTLSYPLCISFLGDLDWGVVVGSYLGALLLGAAYVAIGLFTSSLTRNQIIALILSILICMALFIIGQMLFFIPESILPVVSYLSSGVHFDNIAKGIVDTRDLLYFISIIFLGLYATHLALQEK
jgi:ABC-2 type transport system permease protein